MKNIEEGDVIQITDERHAWFPCLMLVTEVKSWGVQACVLVPESNDGSHKPSSAYNRIRFEQIEKVGKAIVVQEGK